MLLAVSGLRGVGPTASELRERLRAGLVERLTPAGWCQVDDNDDRWLVALGCPVADEFVATTPG